MCYTYHNRGGDGSDRVTNEPDVTTRSWYEKKYISYGNFLQIHGKIVISWITTIASNWFSIDIKPMIFSRMWVGSSLLVQRKYAYN